jgi:hypothetical protein
MVAPDGFDGPRRLSETGLYADIASETLAADVLPYAPLGELWADGTDKRRWVKLPEGASIDTTDMDSWRYPVGTKLWKEFSLAGRRLETRLVEKLGEGEFRMVAYQWSDDLGDAQAVPLGVVDAGGTQHDIPEMEACKQCHDGLADRILGFSALQLAHARDGVTLERLIADGKLSAPPAALPQLPGDDVEQSALAYLHANCGHCHNPDRRRADREISVYFWQESAALGSVQDTVSYRSLVTDKPLPLWVDAVLARMRDRGGVDQMPPLATKIADDAGIAAVDAWMARLRAQFAPEPALPEVPAGTRCDGVETVFEIFERAACRSAFCHGAGTGELDFNTPEALHASLVGVPAVGDGCKDSALPRVQPGDPEHSLLLIKLRPGPPCGKIMPPAAIQALTEADIQQVADWIARCGN